MEENKVALTPWQKEILSSIEKKDSEEFQKVLSKCPKEDINFVDSDRMTPLQQAAYRGCADIVKLLLEHGALVNKCEHEHHYTPLHFGALSGNLEVCHLLLASGAKTDSPNSINRTASQLATFVGYHKIASTINNFIPKEDIDYYCEIHGTQEKPVLDKSLSENVYKFSLLYNVHPLKIAMLLESYGNLVEHIQDVRKVFELISEKKMKCKEVNEVFGFKFYYISFVLNKLHEIIKNGDRKSFVVAFSKKVLKPNKEGHLEYLDNFLREAVKGFPYFESTLFRQMVASLTSPNAPSALSIVSAAINGQRGFADENQICETCGEEKPIKKCSQCKLASYCGQQCQKLHWFVHKKQCTKPATEEKPKNVDSKEISANLQEILGN